jgi:SNF2 family DNA or RNA helicase
LVKASHELQICAGLDPETKEIKDNSKFHAIRDYLLDTGEPALILSNLRSYVIPHLEMVLRKGGLRVGVIVGGDSKVARAVLAEFQAGKIDIVIGQIAVVKMGLDFSRASTILTFNNSYSHDDRVQALARCSNIQKSAPVDVLDFVIGETLDEEIVDILEKKESVSSQYMERKYGTFKTEQKETK